MIAILDAYKAGLLKPRHWRNNIISGMIVGVLALPLVMAFAIASGVNPEQGIYTAIIAGGLAALLGGTRVQITGPTGAFVVILSSVTAQHGVLGLQIATMMAGVILIFMGLFKLGNTIKFIPYPVVVGFTSGIAVNIFVNAWKDFFGLAVRFAIDTPFYLKFIVLVQALPSLDPVTTLISSLGLIFLILWRKYVKFIPAAIILMVVGTLLQMFVTMESVTTIGSVYGHIPRKLPSLVVPNVNFATITSLINAALLISFLGAIESLLSARAADSVCNTKHKSNQELIGQGIANTVAPLFGGFAATGAIGRTMANIRHGGNSPLAALVHALTLVIILFALAPYAEHIPLAILAAILFIISYDMSDIVEFVHIIRKAPRQDVLVLLITFTLTIFTNLITAVAVGVILAMLLFITRIHNLTQIRSSKTVTGMPHLPDDCMVINIDGPFFFGVAEKIEHSLATLHLDVKRVIFRMSEVSMIDLTGIETFSKIIEQYRKRDVKVYLCEANEGVTAKISRAGIVKLAEDKKVYPSIKDLKLD